MPDDKLTKVLPPAGSTPPKGATTSYLRVESLEVKLSGTGHEVVVIAAGQGPSTNGGKLTLLLSPPCRSRSFTNASERGEEVSSFCA